MGGLLDLNMNTFILSLVVFIIFPCTLVAEENRNTVFCSKWTMQKTVHIGRDTVATLRSTIDQIRRCTVIFKLIPRGGCNEMRLACPKFNVPKGPGRLFFARPLGPQPRRQYYNGMRPNGVKSKSKLRVIYRGKNLNELTCRVICVDKDPLPAITTAAA